MFDNYKTEIQDYLISQYPREGVVAITSLGLEFLENIAEEPNEQFRLKKEDTLRIYENGLLAIVHSHPDQFHCPSAQDMKGQSESGVPWGICKTVEGQSTEILWFGDQIEKKQLIGRPFVHGVTDCYNLIRDYYKETYQIELKDYPRDWEWWLKQNLYEEFFGDCGFEIVQDQPQCGDVFLAKIKSNVFNHGGIYLGKELILHHLTSTKPIDFSRISKREPISRWNNFIRLWLRYKK